LGKDLPPDPELPNTTFGVNRTLEGAIAPPYAGPDPAPNTGSQTSNSQTSNMQLTTIFHPPPRAMAPGQIITDPLLGSP
jgi:hypothetical protein